MKEINNIGELADYFEQFEKTQKNRTTFAKTRELMAELAKPEMSREDDLIGELGWLYSFVPHEHRADAKISAKKIRDYILEKADK